MHVDGWLEKQADNDQGLDAINLCLKDARY